MKALILAAALAFAPVAAHAAPPADNAPITDEEVMQRAEICVGNAIGKLTANTVVQGLQLDTLRKKRDFVLQCKMLILGIEAGEAGARKRTPTT